MALVPGQLGMQVAERGGPAPGGQLPGPVHHVPLQDGPQGWPFRLQQCLPGGRQHVGDVPGRPVAGQDLLDPGVDRRLLCQRQGDLVPDLPGRGRPDLVEQIADGGGHPGRDRDQEIRPPARRAQREDHADVGLAGQRQVPVARADQPGAEHRRIGRAREQAQRMGQLPQRRQCEPAHGQILVAHLDPQRHNKDLSSYGERVLRGSLAAHPGPMTSTIPKSRRLPPPPAARTTYRSVFAVGEFRVLFATLLMFVLGFEFEILGLSVRVYAQTRSAFLTALAFSMGFAPQALGGALFTSLADRLPPRLLISAGLLTRAAPGLVIGLWPALPVPAMLALVAAAATTTPVFTAANSAVLPDVLDGDRYILGRSVFSLTGSATQIIGLGIGGAILAALPARRLLLAAGLCLLAAAVVARLGLRPRPSRATGRAPSTDGQTADGQTADGQTADGRTTGGRTTGGRTTGGRTTGGRASRGIVRTTLAGNL